MPLRARTPNLVAALNRDSSVARGSVLKQNHGRAALSQARGSREIGALLPRIYAHRDHLEAFRTRAHAATEWLPSTTALTGLAACAVHGLLEEEPHHLRVAAPSPLHVRSPRWLTLRRCVKHSPAHELGGIRVVGVAEALVHAWEEDPTGLFRDALFAALREGKTSVAAIREALDYYPRIKGRRRLLAFLNHLVDGMQSWLEYVGARTVLDTPDLRRLTFQTRFVLEGHVFFADRYDPVSRTVVEFDSARWHGTPEARARDAWRDDHFRRAGMATVRLPYRSVIDEPQACRAKVRGVIAQRTARQDPRSPP